jgi:hypothetical protein
MSLENYKSNKRWIGLLLRFSGVTFAFDLAAAAWQEASFVSSVEEIFAAAADTVC